MATETDTYRELQKHLDKMLVDYPATKSGVEIKLLKAIFTPRKAKIATHLNYKHKTVAEIFETARNDIDSEEELVDVLDTIVAKGGISRRKQNGRLQ